MSMQIGSQPHGIAIDLMPRQCPLQALEQTHRLAASVADPCIGCKVACEQAAGALWHLERERRFGIFQIEPDQLVRSERCKGR
jgi:hypothetical protein